MTTRRGIVQAVVNYSDTVEILNSNQEGSNPHYMKTLHTLSTNYKDA